MSANKTVIAIDGLAATGKGTLSKKLAHTLNLAHLDTGTLYRAAALTLLNNNLSPEDTEAAVKTAHELAVQLKVDTDILSHPDLRRPDVSQATSKIAKIQAVRDALTDLQRDFARDPGNAYDGAILDGRDIGTVICPEADFKFFVTAQPEIRAKRRYKELQSAGKSDTYPQVLEELMERDARDSTRSVVPTQAAEDAIVIDTSDLDADQVLEKALSIIEHKT